MVPESRPDRSRSRGGQGLHSQAVARAPAWVQTCMVVLVRQARRLLVYIARSTAPRFSSSRGLSEGESVLFLFPPLVAGSTPTFHICAQRETSILLICRSRAAKQPRVLRVVASPKKNTFFVRDTSVCELAPRRCGEAPGDTRGPMRSPHNNNSGSKRAGPSQLLEVDWGEDVDCTEAARVARNFAPTSLLRARTWARKSAPQARCSGGRQMLRDHEQLRDPQHRFPRNRVRRWCRFLPNSEPGASSECPSDRGGLDARRSPRPIS